jgi:hypothetical protein
VFGLANWRQSPGTWLAQEIIVDRIITATNDCSGIKFMGLEARDDIGDTLHAKLCTGVEWLRAAGPPDWHPESNEMLDLVHLSLFPLISCLSRCVTTTRLPWPELLTGSCDSEVMNFVLPNDHGKKNKRESYSFSNEYQWLPSEFKLGDNGAVTIDSYINNLHPHVYADLYQTISEVFASASRCSSVASPTCDNIR